LKKKEYILAPGIFISIGHIRSLIIDVNRQKKWFISTEWARILSDKKFFKLVQLHNLLPGLKCDEIESFTRFLINEMILIPANLQSLDPKRKRKIEKKLPDLKTISVEIKAKAPIALQDLTQTKAEEVHFYLQQARAFKVILKSYKSLPFETVIFELGAKLLEKIDLHKFIGNFTSPVKINVTNSLENKTLKKGLVTIQYFEDSPSLCNQRVTLENITDAYNEHSFFKHHIHISEKVDFKNSIYSKGSFGNIQFHSIEEVRNKVEFQKLWKAKKDDIDVCRDCELSLICIDKRPLIQRRNKTWFSPMVCDYNSYILLKKGEKGYRTLEECGVHSTKRTFSIEIDLFIEQVTGTKGNRVLTNE